jgi:hypothetical protein
MKPKYVLIMIIAGGAKFKLKPVFMWCHTLKERLCSIVQKSFSAILPKSQKMNQQCFILSSSKKLRFFKFQMYENLWNNANFLLIFYKNSPMPVYNLLKNNIMCIIEVIYIIYVMYHILWLHKHI